MTVFVFGHILIGYAQTIKEKVTVDFFYGTWTDSTKAGITFTKEKQVLFLSNKGPERGLEELDLSGVKWNYNIFLDKTPIVIEITCRQCDENPIPKKLFAQIEIINDGQIFFITLNTNGEIKDKLRLTRN